MMRMVRALGRVFAGFEWVLVPPFGPGVAVPAPRPAVDTPSRPLTRREREAFRRIVTG